MNYIQNCVVTFLMIPCISIAMSEEEPHERITIINKTQFPITVAPRTQSMDTGRFRMDPQNNQKVHINRDKIKSVVSYPSGSKKMAFFLLTVQSRNQLKIPFFTDRNSNTVTIVILRNNIVCLNKTKSRHIPAPEITFLQELIDK